MATHDYVIDNSTGANVRSDINNVLQAILTNNSSSSAPSTTAAYMWWADTTTGILKIRNSANDGWVELLQLDGTLTLEDGSASTPGLAFRDDLNTGIFSSAADTFNVATGGVERMELGATTIFNEDGADVDFRIEGDTNANLFYVDAGNNKIGIGTATPSNLLHLKSGAPAIQFEDTDANGSAVSIIEDNNGFLKLRCDTGNAGTGSGIGFEVDGSERMRVDSSGRFMINMSTSVTGGKFQINNQFNTFFAAVNDATGVHLQLEKTRSTSPGSYTIVQDGDILGNIEFKGSNGSASVIGAKILAKVNGTPGSGNDIPTDLIFRMQPDGSGSTQEAMRIRSDRTVEIATEGAIAGFASSAVTNNIAPLKIYKNSSVTHSAIQLIWDHFNTSTGISQRIQFTIGDDASSDGFNNAGFIGIEKADSWQSGSGRSAALIFGTTSAATESEKMRITGSGIVMIATTSTVSNGTGAKLQIVPDNNNPAIACKHTGTNDGNIIELQHQRAGTNSGAFTGTAMSFRQQDGTQVGTIVIANTATQFNTSSDYRLKENISAISDGITRLKTLKPYRFNFKGDSKIVDGFFAHEVTAVPEAITGTKDEVDSNGNPKYQGIDQSKLVPLLVAAVKELITKVEALEAA